MMNRDFQWLGAVGLLVLLAPDPCAVAEAASDAVVFQVASVVDEDDNPLAAGKSVAEALKQAMGPVPLKAVLVSECFEDQENKEKLLQGICSVLPPELVMGAATYGSFTQKGCTSFDSVCLLGIGGEGISVCAALVSELGTAKLAFDTDQALIRQRLHAAGAKLAGMLSRSPKDRLLVLLADAHSPKNQFLVEGLQQALGKDFAITGGCANKNAGQTFVYFRGKAYPDAAVGLLLSGDFAVSLVGRRGNDQPTVIATAREGAQAALAGATGKPFGVLAFNCAGRRSKLARFEDELAAMQAAFGKDLPLFGCYCAGEMGPIDAPEKPTDARCGGSGWHVMFSVLSR